MTRTQKQDYAKVLYLNDSLTQKEIADKVGVTEKTIGSWIKKGNWPQLKSSLIITKDEELRRIYVQINQLNNHIETREEGSRYADAKEADTLSKLAATARAMESDASLSDVIAVFKRFANWLRKIDLAKAQEFISIQDEFVKTLLR